MNEIETVSELIQKFPGIGRRQAKRLSYFFLQSNTGYIKKLMKSIAEMRQTITTCSSCFAYTQKQKSGTLCNTCEKTKDKSLLLLVEKM